MSKCLAALAALFLIAAGPHAGTVPATVVRVVDGDTVAVLLHPLPGRDEAARIRLTDLETPELRCWATKEKAEAARYALARLLPPGTQVMILEIRRGKYAGRWLGRITHNGIDAATHMIDSGHGRRYLTPRPKCPPKPIED